MQFSKVFLAAAAFAVANAVNFTMTTLDTITAGSAYDITWGGASGPVTILLKSGPSSALVTVATIAQGQTGTSFSWTPPSTIPDGTYAFEIDDASSVNYSKQFTFTGGAASSASVASSSASASISTVVSTSASATSSVPTLSSTASGNSTKTSTTASKTSAGTASTTSSTTTTTPKNANSAASLASPLALVFLALAAIMTLH